MSIPSYKDAGIDMLQRLAGMVVQAENQGYVIAAHCAPDFTLKLDSTVPFNPMVNALTAWLEHWGRMHGRRCIVVNIAPFRDSYSLWFRVPRRKPFLPVVASLGLMSKKKAHRYDYETKGSGFLTVAPMSEWYEYRGEGSTALEVVCRVFDAHKEILTQIFRPTNKE